MPISVKHKAIFVHIPKTGGVSIESILWPDPNYRIPILLWHGRLKDQYAIKGTYQHLFAKHMREVITPYFGNVFDEYFKFTIVRNPWSRALSQWGYMVRGRKNIARLIGMEQEDSLETTLELIMASKEFPEARHVQWEPQYKFILDDDGKSLVDYIGNVENYDESFKFIMDKLGVEVDEIPCLNNSRPFNDDGTRESYRTFYTEGAKKLVEELYAEDIKIFGYKF